MDKIELINQGTYGCIYHPGLTCKGKISNDRFITKIQKRRENSDKETQIGKAIKKIKQFQNYFGPVLESCPINISTIDNKELKKCDFVAEKPNAIYMSNRIRYIGSETLADYLLRIFKTNHKLFLSTLADSYLHILTSLTLLNDKKVVHMDLKENNIVMDTRTEKPIIIDFGMSFFKTDVPGLNDKIVFEKKQLKEIFFVYGSDYAPWCIEISIISYINEIKNTDVLVTQEHLEFITQDFLNTNPIFLHVTPDEGTAFHTSIMAYLKPMIGEKWKVLVSKLLESIDTWDNYAIATIMLQIIRNMDIDALSPIIDTLKTVVLSMPDKRMNAVNTSTRIVESVNKIAKTRELLQKLQQRSKDKDFIQELTNKNKNTKMAGLKRGEHMNQKMLI